MQGGFQQRRGAAVAHYKRCPQCKVELKPEVPVCYVCNTPQPGFENATLADRDAFDDALTRKNEKPDTPKTMLIAIMVGWVVVLGVLVAIFYFNHGFTGPGGPQG
ncbi:MAG: hypothetical protein ABI743_00405 [bacterium]